MSTNQTIALDDVQGRSDHRKIVIDRVGIRGLKYPITVKGKSGEVQAGIGNFGMYVFLPAEKKGTHMSRFIEFLDGNERLISAASFSEYIPSMLQKLESDQGQIEIQFTYFLNKAAPVSKKNSLVDYEVSLTIESKNGIISQNLKVIVPVTSLCPCSKKISEYGAHNQRSHIIISVLIDLQAHPLHIEELIQVAESSASCELYGILKRPDEKHVTERAYDNAKFAEDMIRDVANQLNRDDRVLAYQLETENFESIHNHSAYAFIEVDKRD